MSNNYGDTIKLLPIDKSSPLQQELILMNSLFTDTSNPIKKSSNYILPLIIFCLFYIMSLPQLDTKINKYITTSSYLMILFKSIIFIIIYILLTIFIK